MKILIATDMEGVTGVVNWDQITPGHFEYPRFRKLMTQDVNAAITGAFEAGASEIVVSDGHWHGTNILIEELDSRVRLNSSTSSPYSMMQGIDETFDGVIFVGYHARHGSPNAVCDHTWSSACVANLWLNDLLVGEFGLNGALAGYYGVPIIMVTGDQTACEQTVELLGGVETAVVKQATGRYSAECLPPEASHKLISDAARRAITKLSRGKAPDPFIVDTPVLVTVDFRSSDMADRGLRMPGTQRDGTRISIEVPDMNTAYSAFRAIVGLAAN
ncbi:MAG: M55 family metallopeptidase [Chloroflexi bacterium]|nr:M55 family metallopeptidase [Chloroflexota bacterium]